MMKSYFDSQTSLDEIVLSVPESSNAISKRPNETKFSTSESALHRFSRGSSGGKNGGFPSLGIIKTMNWKRKVNGQGRNRTLNRKGESTSAQTRSYKHEKFGLVEVDGKVQKVPTAAGYHSESEDSCDKMQQLSKWSRYCADEVGAKREKKKQTNLTDRYLIDELGFDSFDTEYDIDPRTLRKDDSSDSERAKWRSISDDSEDWDYNYAEENVITNTPSWSVNYMENTDTSSVELNLWNSKNTQALWPDDNIQMRNKNYQYQHQRDDTGERNELIEQRDNIPENPVIGAGNDPRTGVKYMKEQEDYIRNGPEINTGSTQLCQKDTESKNTMLRKNTENERSDSPHENASARSVGFNQIQKVHSKNNVNLKPTKSIGQRINSVFKQPGTSFRLIRRRKSSKN